MISIEYAAGIIDGEGCIGAYNTRPKKDTRAAYYQLTVRVCMKSLRVIRALQELFGGTILQTRCDRRKSVYFTWQTRNRQAEIVLKQIVPFLIEKKDQALVALEFAEFRRTQRAKYPRSKRYPKEALDARDVYVNKLKELKKSNMYEVN